MTFFAPIWLLGLFPWAALTIWLLWGRRRKEGVPFLPLWEGQTERRRARRWVQTPPMALAAAIVAIFVAIVAAGQPMMHVDGGKITCVVERGGAISASP